MILLPNLDDARSSDKYLEDIPMKRTFKFNNADHSVIQIKEDCSEAQGNGILLTFMFD